MSVGLLADGKWFHDDGTKRWWDVTIEASAVFGTTAAAVASYEMAAKARERRCTTPPVAVVKLVPRWERGETILYVSFESKEQKGDPR